MTLANNFICDQRAEQVINMAREVLGENMVLMQVNGIKFSENFEESSAKLEAKLVEISETKAKKRIINGEGVGLVDACFDAMLKTYGDRFCSLDAIAIVDFSVSAHVSSLHARNSDAKISARLRVKNSQNYEYAFECTTSSISHSSVAAVQEAMAFFINAELAYVCLYSALKDAKERNRQDLVERYQNQMATLVQATSYEKLVHRLKA